MIRILSNTSNLLAIIPNPLNPTIKKEINGEYTLSFEYVLDDELKSEYLIIDNLCEVEGQLFVITKLEYTHTDDNQISFKVNCEHISYKLIDEELPSFTYTQKTPTQLLTAICAESIFDVGNVTVGGIADIEIDEPTNKRAVLNEIVELFGGELELNNYLIGLVVELGMDRGVQFRIGKNILGITKTIDNTTLTEQGNPSVSYEVDLLALDGLEQYQGLEGFELGDTVTIIDAELNINVKARIISLEYDPINKRNTKINLGEYKESYIDALMEIQKSANLVVNKSVVWDRAKAISAQGTIFTDILEGEINANQNMMRAGLGTVTITDNNGILITDQATEQASTRALRLLGGQLAISNSKDINGNFVYRTFGTGDGFSADEIKTGTLSANRIGAGSITIEKLSGDVADKIGLAIGDSIDLSSNPILISYGNQINTVDGRVTVHESLIQQNANNITLKVSKNNIISEINQSAEAITIDASKVNISGFVTLSNLTDGVTTISGANIKTGTITSVDIDLQRDIRVGNRIILGSAGDATSYSDKIIIENVNGVGYLKGSSQTTAMKFWNSPNGGGIWVNNDLMIGRTGWIGVHNGITGSTLYPLIELETNYVKFLNATNLGFYGKTPISKPSVTTTALAMTASSTIPNSYDSVWTLKLRTDLNNTLTRVNDIHTALKNLGLL